MGQGSNTIQFPGARNTQQVDTEATAKIRKHKLARVYTIVLVLVLLAAVLIGYFIYERSKIFDSMEIVSSINRDNIDGTKIREFAGSVMTYSKDGAGAMDASGKLLWNQTFDMQNPMASVNGEMAAFADYGGSRIYLQKASGETGVVNTDMPIRKITVSANGYVAAVLEDLDVTWIYLYDSNGTKVAYFRTTMEKSGYPIDIDISPDAELVCVSYYYIDCNDLKSSVAFYNFGSVGQNSIDNYVSGFNYPDEMIPYVEFLDTETAIAVSDSRISVFAGAHKPVSVSEMFINDEVISVFTGSDAFAAIYSNEAHGTKYRLEVYDKEGKKTSEKAFDFDYSNVTFGNGCVILYGDTSVYVGTYAGKLKYEGDYSRPILLLVPQTASGKFTIVTEDTIDSVELK
ncbi:MAG: DUF5711 family protein [Lachnospiraceae bacterium]|nr:DUF5711 family protein [Lachnospiraceae bacterium]